MSGNFKHGDLDFITFRIPSWNTKEIMWIWCMFKCLTRIFIYTEMCFRFGSRHFISAFYCTFSMNMLALILYGRRCCTTWLNRRYTSRGRHSSACICNNVHPVCFWYTPFHYFHQFQHLLQREKVRPIVSLRMYLLPLPKIVVLVWFPLQK